MSKRPYTRRSPNQWQEPIDNQQTSGLTIAAYYQQHQLATSNFYHWRSQLNNHDVSTLDSTENDWLAMPSQTQANNTHAKVTLSLPGGITLCIEPT